MTVEGRTGGGGAVGRIVARATAANVELAEQLEELQNVELDPQHVQQLALTVNLALLYMAKLLGREAIASSWTTTDSGSKARLFPTR
jgi:uncharacterized membrane protein YqjE